MHRHEDEQLPVYNCPECDVCLVMATADDQVQVTLHRVLHVRSRSERLGYMRLIMGEQEERLYPVL